MARRAEVDGEAAGGKIHPVRVVPMGVRGSTPAPGIPFVRYGGHTSCVAVLRDDEDMPHLLLDAGTGIRALPGMLGGAAFQGQIVLSHLHWDHLHGLPFCPAVDRPDAQVTLHIPVEQPDDDPVALLSRAMSPPHFPIGPEGLIGDWRFRPLTAGRIDDVLTVAPIAHKGGVAYGIRVELDTAVLAYLPDHALHSATTPGERSAARDLVAGADVLLHDGQFLDAEDAVAVAYGHATIERVIDFADECAVGSLVLTHHGPSRTDDALDQFAETFQRTPGGRPVSVAVQGVPIAVHARR
jgi:phosphoribosyl 1,2-cyclic phosphodiesterase